MSRKKGRGYPRDFRLNAARLVVEGGYTYAVKGMLLTAGDSPARQGLLQPVAIGAVVDARKLLKSLM